MKPNKFDFVVNFNITIILVQLVLFTQLSNAQNNQIVFDHYGLEAGFTAKEARDIVTSKNGLVWISSNNGLVRYDSKRFKFYQNISGDTNSIASNICSYLEIDKRGWIWISCKDNIDVFDPVSEKFSHIIIPYNYKKTKWRKQFEINLEYDENKDIMWMPTKNGLFFCKSGILKPQSISSLTNDTTIISDPIFSVLPIDQNNLWVTSGLKFFKLNTQSGDVEKHTIPKLINTLVNDEEFSYIKSIYQDKNKTLWLGTWRNGLVEYNSQTNRFNQYYFNQSSSTAITIFDIKQLKKEEQNNLLYISSFGIGFSTFDIVTKKFQSYKSPFIADINGIKGDTYNITIDTEGSAVWIGSETGLHKLDLTKQLFKSFNLNSLSKELNLPPVNVIAVERSTSGIDEKLWIKIPDKGTYICNLSNNEILPTPIQLAKYLGNSFDFFYFFIDSKNRLWINNNKYGLICYDIKLAKIIIAESKYFFDKKEWITTFFEDKQGTVWLGTKNGLFYWDETTKNIVGAQEVNKKLQSENLAKGIQSITEDKFGNLWFTSDESNTRNSCIGKYNLNKKNCEIIFDEAKYKGILAYAVSISNIVVNNKNKVFLCDNNNGLLWFTATQKNPILKKIINNSAINSNEFTSIINDGNNNIWCNTNFGIAFYNTGTETFTNYSYADYAIGTKMQPAIYLSTQSGNLYIGQSNVVNYFNTNLLKVNSNNSKLIFTDIKLFNEIYKKNNGTITNDDELIFAHNQNTISIEFVLLSYTNSNNNLYSWKLEGLETNWNISKNNLASYYQLSPGKYTLLVKAANSNGIWSSQKLRLHIIIKPPFYNTWWFILFCILCVIGTIFYFVQQKIKRIKDKYQLRNKIASDLHDEIGSTLTSINILSNVSQQAMDKQPQQAKEMLHQISAQSKTIQQNMSDIVWSIRPDNEKIENLVTRIREYAAQTLEPLNIATRIEADDNLIEKTLPIQHRKNILLICKEAINNIAKHSNATTAKILFTNSKNRITLSIEDDGKWKGNSSGTGTKSMHERASALGGHMTMNANEFGTKILVSIPIP